MGWGDSTFLAWLPNSRWAYLFGLILVVDIPANAQSIRLADFPRPVTAASCRAMNDANIRMISELRQSYTRQHSRCTDVYEGLAASQCQRRTDPLSKQIDAANSAASRRNGECVRVAAANRDAEYRQQQAIVEQQRAQQDQQRRQVELQASTRIQAERARQQGDAERQALWNQRLQAERAAQANAQSAAKLREEQQSQMWQRAIDAVRAVANDGGNAAALARSARAGTAGRVLGTRQLDELRGDSAFAAGEAMANRGRLDAGDEEIEGAEQFDDALDTTRTLSGAATGRARDTANQAAIGYYSRTIKNAVAETDSEIDALINERNDYQDPE